MAADIAAILTANISEFKAKMAEADVSMKTMTESGSSNFSKLATVGKGMALGLGVAIAGVGVAAVHFGSQLEESQAGLQAALKAAGISWGSVSSSVAATGSQMTKYGFTQAQVDSALTKGVISTQSYSKAHANLTVAVQLAAAKHVDLGVAMQAVDKATLGNTRALMQMGISLPIVATNALKLKTAQDALNGAQLAAFSFLQTYPDALDNASKHHAAYQALVDKVAESHKKLTEQQQAGGQILDALSQRLGGQAAAAASTFSGRIAAAKAEGENLFAAIGMHLIPVLMDLMTAIQGVVTWLEKHRAAAEALGIAIGTVLVVAITAYIASMAAAAVATIAATWPILAVIAAVAALVVGIVFLVNNWTTIWDTISTFLQSKVGLMVAALAVFMLPILAIPVIMAVVAANWQSVWSVIQSVMQTAWSILGPIFNFIKTLGTDIVVANILFLQAVWGAAWAVISGAISGAWGVISAVIAAISFAVGGIAGAINAMATAWHTVWGGLSGAVSAAWGAISTIIGAISAGINGVVGALNALNSLVHSSNVNTNSPAGKTAASQLMLNNAAGRAIGGPVSALTPYIVGEHGPELFIPAAAGVISPSVTTGAAVGAGVQGGGSATFNLHINGIQFATAVFPDFWTVMLQQKRSMLTLNLS